MLAVRGCNSAFLFAVVDHTIVLTTGTDTGAGTNGDVYLKLVGSGGSTTPWQLVTSGGEYDDENENGE